MEALRGVISSKSQIDQAKSLIDQTKSQIDQGWYEGVIGLPYRLRKKSVYFLSERFHHYLYALDKCHMNQVKSGNNLDPDLQTLYPSFVLYRKLTYATGLRRNVHFIWAPHGQRKAVHVFMEHHIDRGKNYFFSLIVSPSHTSIILTRIKPKK